MYIMLVTGAIYADIRSSFRGVSWGVSPTKVTLSPNRKIEGL